MRFLISSVSLKWIHFDFETAKAGVYYLNIGRWWDFFIDIRPSRWYNRSHENACLADDGCLQDTEDGGSGDAAALCGGLPRDCLQAPEAVSDGRSGSDVRGIPGDHQPDPCLPVSPCHQDNGGQAGGVRVDPCGGECGEPESPGSHAHGQGQDDVRTGAGCSRKEVTI